MKNKILKITLSQIIMWILVFLQYIIGRAISGNDDLEIIVILVLPVIFLIYFSIVWVSNNVYTKEEAIFKWIINYFICLAMWIVETVICTIITNYLIPQNDLLRPYTYAYLIDSIYAVVIISVAAIMHMLSTLINLYKKGQILHIIVNILLVAFLAISVYCGGMGHDGSFVVALVLVNMCFIYNYCHKKCIP